MKIKLTDFALRHFDPKFGGTKILDMTPEKFEEEISKFDILINPDKDMYYMHYFIGGDSVVDSIPGYASFCKLLPVENFTDARVSYLPITLENYQYLRTDYSARKEGELPVLSRWFDLPPIVKKPVAKYLMLILYSKEQIDKEGREMEGEGKDPNEKYVPFEGDWGIVAILAQDHPFEEPMQPVTMMRNALGKSYGGSGVDIDNETYLESVEFWSKHAMI